MARILARFVEAPTSLEWWAYIKLVGAVSLIVLLSLLLLGVPVPALVVGLVLHLALDFPLQSPSTSARKGDRGIALTIHSIVVGGIPNAIVGLYAGPGMALAGCVVGIITHYATDYTRKFGCKSVLLGVLLDQAAHAVVLLVVSLVQVP